MLSIGPQPAYAPVSAMLTTQDDCNIEYMSRLTYMTSGVVTNTDTAGAILFETPLTCCPNLLSASVGDNIYAPLFETVCSHFSRVNCDLRYRFQFASPSMSQLKIAAFTSFQTYTTPSTLVNAASQYGQIFTVSADSNTFEVVVPYRSRTKQMFVPKGPVSAENLPN
jgi:hypothetical protein